MIRYADFRIDASAIQSLPDGSIKVVGQLTHAGVFHYTGPTGARREYRPKEEVFSPRALATFAQTTITRDHPPSRKVSPEVWRTVTIGNVGDNVRQDGNNAVADLYIRDATAVADVRSGKMSKISCGYEVDYDASPGVTDTGERYDGIQRNLRGNHVALLPAGIAPRGGDTCTLRLDSVGDEILDEVKLGVTLEQALAEIARLNGELNKTRNDSDVGTAQVTELTAKVATLTAQLSPERLDALVAERTAKVVAQAALVAKRAKIVERTPALKTRVDSMDDNACDAVLAVYETQPDPTMAAAIAVTGGAPPAVRTDAAVKPLPKVSDMYKAHVKASRDAWKNKGEG